MSRHIRRTLAICSLSALAACGDGSESASQATAARNDAFCGPALAAVEAHQATLTADANRTGPSERYGGSVVVGGGGELAGGMNGLVSADHSAAQHQSFVNLMTLVKLDSNLESQPYLAESWEVSEDATTLTFTLRDDVRWHDGQATDAEDVVFSYERATNPETGFPNPAFWDNYAGIEQLDARTVRLTMEPHADYLDPWRTFAILPEHLLGDVPATELGQHPYGTQCPVGNGPFVFSEHRPQESWTFTANPDFPTGLGGRPYVDRYVYRVVPEPTTLLTDLLTEQADVYVKMSPDQAERVEAEDGIELVSFQFRDVEFIVWNSRLPELSDARVRRAMTLGTNRAEIVEALLGGYGQVANTSVPPFHWAHDASLDAANEYDPEAAAALLEEAGWIDRDGDGVREDADGLPLSVEMKYSDGNQRRQDVAEIMQAQLSQIGVELTPTVVEYSTFVEQMTQTRDFGAVSLTWVVEFKVDDTDLFSSERADGIYAFSGTNNADMDALLGRLQTIVDRDESRPVWYEYQRVLNEEHPYTFLFYADRLVGVNERLQGVAMDVRGEWINIKDWWIEPASR